MQFKHTNLWRALPVGCGGAVGIYYLLDRAGQPYPVALILIFVAVCGFGVMIRLGRLPWFETRTGKKQALVLWLEKKIPILRSEFYRRRRD